MYKRRGKNLEERGEKINLHLIELHDIYITNNCILNPPFLISQIQDRYSRYDPDIQKYYAIFYFLSSLIF